ncbi:MAG: hypothetical protein IJ494_04145 [Bacteroides sp.]|nr:hypothetical protein [Bacteroides sp.]
MGKIKYILLITLLSIVVYVIINELTFIPLNTKDLNILFPNYSGKLSRTYHKDFIGWGQGDYFDYFVFQLDTVSINSNHPQWIKEWEYVSLPDEVEKSKWLSCPVDSIITSKFSLEMDEIINCNIQERFLLKEEIENPNNFYSYLYVSSLEKYFLLINPLKKKLYYIRQKGF